MRWLFLFVLMLNVAYVVWEWSQPESSLDAPIIDKGVSRIVLLSEIGQESVAVLVTDNQAVSDQSGKANVDVEGGCFTLGPFKKLEKLRAVTRGIKEYVVDASFRSREEKEQAMFWVYLDPLENYKEAKALADRLKKSQVKDYFIVNSGPKNNGISLGHFREKNRAYIHAGHIKGLGFEPKVETIFKTYTIFWLDYDVASGKSIPKNILDKHVTGKINRLVRDCS